jgi:DNA-binding transcriptional ArsR family regulator
MGVSKAALFSPNQNAVAARLKALSHPARVAILEFLLNKNACICGDLVNELPLAQPTISQHLKEMKQAGIIKGSIEGNTICYCIDENIMRLLQTYFEDIATKLNNKTTSCC